MPTKTAAKFKVGALVHMLYDDEHPFGEVVRVRESLGKFFYDVRRSDDCRKVSYPEAELEPAETA